MEIIQRYQGIEIVIPEEGMSHNLITRAVQKMWELGYTPVMLAGNTGDIARTRVRFGEPAKGIGTGLSGKQCHMITFGEPIVHSVWLACDYRLQGRMFLIGHRPDPMRCDGIEWPDPEAGDEKVDEGRS